MPSEWIVFSSFVVGLCFGWESSADERERQIRARLLWTPLETELEVELENGQEWNGSLVDLDESTVLLLCEPDKETRKRLGLRSGMKLKKAFRYEDIVAVDGAVKPGEVERYLVLQLEETSRMQGRLTAAALAGYRVVASAGRRNVILEKVDSSAPFAYVVPDDVGQKREGELDEWGAKGFRVAPRTIGASFGKPSAILERGADDAVPRDYRVLETSRDKPLEEEFFEAVRQGFRLVGLTTPGPTIVLLESGSPAVEENSEYQLLRDFDSEELSRAAREGKRLVACSDGEPLCVFEKTGDGLGEDAYEFLAASRISTLEEELNEAGRRGYRLHPRSLGVMDAVVSESFAIMERTDSPSGFEYRIVSAKRGSDIGEKVSRAAREGFHVVTATAERKRTWHKHIGTGLTGLSSILPGARLGAQSGSMLFTTLADVFVVMERPIR